MKRKFLNYIADFYFGATQYPCGWFKPKVVRGDFSGSVQREYQLIFFRELQEQGFRRTNWQLIFPGQIAALVKKIPPREDGVNEYHVRFYADGVIDCELEVARFHSMHWVGPRRHGTHLLDGLLSQSVTITDEKIKIQIQRLFGTKHYTQKCVRKS